MSTAPDAIIIGTGVIGTATAFELAKLGYKTLSVDRNRQIGHGSTAGSCAIIRMHYSTLDGTAFAWEGYHYWRDWAEYLALPSDADLARFREVGCLVMKTELNGHLEKHMKNSAALDCPFEEWSPETIVEKLPIYSTDSYAPPRRMDQDGFGEPNGRKLKGAVFWPHAGYVTDPALSCQNLADAARPHDAAFRLGVEVAEILQEGGRTKGIKLADGEEIHCPIVINVAGPGSAIINRMAGVTGDMTIETRPLRQEVVHVPAPEGFDFEANGTIVSDSDIACYCRPEHGNHILIGSEDPECDPHQWRTTTPITTATSPISGRRRRCAMRSGCRALASRPRPAASSISMTLRPTGSRSMTSLLCPASTWPAARAGTSTRTRPSPGK
jgi:sarcosine oxidase subunit beta